MGERKSKYLGNKIIALVSISFLILTLGAAFLVYSLLQKNTSLQIEDFTTNSFNSFAKRLDDILLGIEKTGERYCEDIMKSITAGNLANQYEALTSNLQSINPYVSEVVVYLFPDINHPNLVSFFYYRSNKLSHFNKLDTSSDFFNKLLANPIINNPMQHKEKYWSEPYYSLFVPSFPLVGTLSIPLIKCNDEKRCNDGGELYGVVALSFRLSHLNNVISKFNLGGNSYNVLLGNNGNICVHPIEKYIMKETDLGYNISFFEAIYDDNSEIPYTEFNEDRHYKFDKIELDSLGEFKCENSFALSYRLRNNWRFLTIFSNDLFYSYNDSSIIFQIAITLLILSMLFFVVVNVGTNKILKKFKMLISQLYHFRDYDILDWKLEANDSNDDLGILSRSFNRLHKAYTNVQNRFTDLLTENEKLTFNKSQIDEKIAIAIKEETDAIMAQNQYLTASLSNVADFIQLGKTICSTLSIEEISKVIYEQLERLIPVAFFGIFTYNKEKDKLECEYGILEKQVFQFFSLDISEKSTVAVKCFDAKEPISINNFDVEFKKYLFVPVHNPIGIQAASRYYAPIMDQENVLGVFTIQCKEKGVFKDFNPEFLETLTTYLNLSIRNISTYRELKISLENIKTAQDKLIQSERMAAVGQLAAEIADEIRYTLSFIHNFSDLSNAAIKNICDKIEKYKSNPDKELLYDIEDIIGETEANLIKIKEHTIKLDEIVKEIKSHSNENAKDPDVNK